jgi:hypothetical protein
MLRWILIAGAVYALLCFLASRSVYFPMREGMWEMRDAIGATDVWLTAADGVRLHAWWLESPGARFVTLFLHGNAGNISHRADRMREIAAAGSSVLMLDYRGYGKSEGRPTENGLYADASAAWNYLARQGHQRIVIHGESIGTAIAVELASRQRCAGMVLEAPFLSAGAVAGRVLPLLGPVLIWGFDSKSRLGRVRAPLLVIHGDRDDVIAFDLGRALYEAASGRKEFWKVEGAGHNDLMDVAGARYRERLTAFYRLLE